MLRFSFRKWRDMLSSVEAVMAQRSLKYSDRREDVEPPTEALSPPLLRDDDLVFLGERSSTVSNWSSSFRLAVGRFFVDRVARGLCRLAADPDTGVVVVLALRADDVRGAVVVVLALRVDDV